MDELEKYLEIIAEYYNQYIPLYFRVNYQGEPFQRFDLSHLIVLGITILLTLLIILTRRKLDNENKASIREVLAQILIINEIVFYLWLYFYKGATILEILPPHPISILAWLSAFMLLKKGKKLYELVYFLGIIGALYNLLTPNLEFYGFPHYRFFYALITPAVIFLSVIHMTFAEEDIRPYWKSLLRVFITANIFIAIVYAINTYFGSNYLYLNAKPVGSKLFDLLPEWPIYILYFEVIGIAVSLILYIPFLIKDWLGNRGLKNADTSRLDDFTY